MSIEQSTKTKIFWVIVLMMFVVPPVLTGKFIIETMVSDGFAFEWNNAPLMKCIAVLLLVGAAMTGMFGGLREAVLERSVLMFYRDGTMAFVRDTRFDSKDVLTHLMMTRKWCIYNEESESTYINA